MEQRSKEEVEKVLKSYDISNYDEDTMELIREDLEDGVREDFIDRYVSKNLNIEQKKALSDAARSGIPFEYYVVLTRGYFSPRQIGLLRNYYFKGITAEQVEKNIKKSMSTHSIKKALDQFLEHVPAKEIVDMVSEESKQEEKETEPLQSTDETENTEPPEEENKNTEKKEQQNDSFPTNRLFQEEFRAFEEKMDQAMQSLHQEMSRCIDRITEHGRQLVDYKNEVLENQLKQMQSEFNLQQEFNSTLSRDNDALQNRFEQMESKLRTAEEDLKKSEERREVQYREHEKAMQEVNVLRKEKEDMMKKAKEFMDKKDKRETKAQERTEVGALSFEEAARHYEEEKPSQSGNKMAGQMDVVLRPQREDTQELRIERTTRRNRDGLLAMAGKKLFGGKVRTGLIKCIQDAKLSMEQMKQVGNAIKAGLTDTELMELIKSGMEADKMEQMIEIVVMGRQY